MVYKGFLRNIILRLVLLVASLATFIYLILNKEWIFSSAIIGFLVLLIIYELFSFITKTNKDLSKFIDAINYQEYSVNFSSYKLGNAFDELHESFRKTLTIFRNLRLEKEAHYQYMLRMVKHIDMGIIAFNHEQKIILYNQTAQDLLQVPNLIYWNRYEEKIPAFYHAVINDKSGAKSLIKLDQNREISLRSSRFLVEDKEHFVIVFQNIKAEIEDKEIDAWNKLIKLLTHEIMNSVTPISSLSDTLLSIEKSADAPDEDLLEGLSTIHRRSQTLLKFVDDYRKLSNIPAPNKSTFKISDLFTQLEILYKSEIEAHGITFKIPKIESNAEILIDETLILKVFDNLISNSIHALKGRDNPTLEIDFKEREGKKTITITDNGFGISKEKIGQVFIPFFSTKPTGTGIGLSLSRQILQMHQAVLKIESEKDAFCKVSLRF